MRFLPHPRNRRHGDGDAHVVNAGKTVHGPQFGQQPLLFEAQARGPDWRIGLQHQRIGVDGTDTDVRCQLGGENSGQYPVDARKFTGLSAEACQGSIAVRQETLH